MDEKPAIAGWGEDRLFPFEVTFDLTGVPPGDYVVDLATDDPRTAVPHRHPPDHGRRLTPR